MINKKRNSSFLIQGLIIVVDKIRYFPPVMSREQGLTALTGMCANSQFHYKIQTSASMKKNKAFDLKKEASGREKTLNEKQTSWIGRKPDGLFDIKKPLWHFRKAVPEWFPRNFRKAWYKTHRYLSNIHCNLLFYLQTETCVPGPLQPPSPCHRTDLVSQKFPHNICLSSSFPLVSCPCLHLLQSPISPSDCPSRPYRKQ